MKIHLANTDFEFELGQPESSLTLEEVWKLYPLCLQLQFLPFLYANVEDAVAVTAYPNPQFLETLLHIRKQTGIPHLRLLKETLVSYDQCISWGASKRVKQWAESKGIPYVMPPWNVVKEINSKLFSFTQAPYVEGAALIKDRQELNHWLKQACGQVCILKTCFGVAGRGHYFINETTSLDSVYQFCEKEWHQQRPLVGELWLERLLDFSTQWSIGEDIQCIGATIFQTDARGVYKATLAGPEEILFKNYHAYLEEHKQIALSALQEAKRKGFFGYAGVDAFLYRSVQGIRMRPLVEINGRQTMSLVALKFQRQWFPQQTIRFMLTHHKYGHSYLALLPTYLVESHDRLLNFRHQLYFSLHTPDFL